MSFLGLKNRIRPLLDTLDGDRQVRDIFRNFRRLRYSFVSHEAGNDAIKDALISHKSVLVGRVGASEMKVVRRFLLRQKGLRIPYGKWIRHEICVNSGVLPVTDECLDRFADYYIQCSRDIDIFCAWFIPGENYLISEARPAITTTLQSLEPFCHKSPWSFELAEKTVLVVTPFVDTFKRQLGQLRLVWGYDLFPGVEFKFIRFPHSQGLVENRLPRPWFEIIEEKKIEISETSFDVGLVGAGAGTLPLARHIKVIGKTGIAMGGALQLLFGVRGRRWDVDPRFDAYFNEHWVRPLQSETPAKFESNENGAYW